MICLETLILTITIESVLVKMVPCITVASVTAQSVFTEMLTVIIIICVTLVHI